MRPTIIYKDNQDFCVFTEEIFLQYCECLIVEFSKDIRNFKSLCVTSLSTLSMITTQGASFMKSL